MPPGPSLVELVEELHVRIRPHGHTPRDVNTQSAAHEGEGVWVTARDISVDEGDRLVKHLAESSRNLVNGCALLAAWRKVVAATVVAEDLDDLKADH